MYVFMYVCMHAYVHVCVQQYVFRVTPYTCLMCTHKAKTLHMYVFLYIFVMGKQCYNPAVKQNCSGKGFCMNTQACSNEKQQLLNRKTKRYFGISVVKFNIIEW